MIIRAVVHKAEEGGLWAEVPALPGCMTQADTLEELKRNLQEAVELWLEGSALTETTGKDDQILELTV